MKVAKSWSVSGAYLLYAIIVIALIVRSVFFEYEMTADVKMFLGWTMVMLNIESLKDKLESLKGD